MPARLICIVLGCLTCISIARARITIPVDSPAAAFSPGNWAGDTGRGGHQFRITWNNGAYCTWRWSTTGATSTATLQITNATDGSAISYFLDGDLLDNIAVPHQSQAASALAQTISSTDLRDSTLKKLARGE